MFWLKFSGWFECRLATDLDPTDEPRGVSGYMRAVAGEPDLDRIIRLQPRDVTARSRCPKIGVRVDEVVGDFKGIDLKSLIGADVDLLDSPRFEGRNHATAQDGNEAIYPFHLQISKERFLLRRTFKDGLTYPPTRPGDADSFAQLKATGINFCPGAIADATGVADLAAVWAKRCQDLQSDLAANRDPVVQAALRSRISSMSIMDKPGAPNARPANARYFGARMLYTVAMTGRSQFLDPDGYLAGKTVPNAVPWTCDFWMGAWDADAMCGFMQGYLGLPVILGAQAAEVGRAVEDPRLRRG